MKPRFLIGLAVAPSTFAMLSAGPAGAVSGPAVTEQAKAAADSVGMLAGSMVVAAGVAFAGTGLVRRRKGIRR